METDRSALERWRRDPIDGRTRRILSHLHPATAELREDIEIEEVHGAQDEQHDSQLTAQRLEDAPRIRDLVRELQVEAHEPDVDEVEPHHEEMIHAVSELCILSEIIDQEDPVVLVKRLCYLYCEWNR